jgi:hypothetical protein
MYSNLIARGYVLGVQDPCHVMNAGRTSLPGENAASHRADRSHPCHAARSIEAAWHAIVDGLEALGSTITSELCGGWLAEFAGTGSLG